MESSTKARNSSGLAIQIFDDGGSGGGGSGGVGSDNDDSAGRVSNVLRDVDEI